MCNKDIESYKFMCVGVIFLAFNVLLHTKSEQKVIGNCFCTTITFNDPLKTGFSIINLLLCWACLNVIGYFLFEKQAFNGRIIKGYCYTKDFFLITFCSDLMCNKDIKA